MRMTMVLTVLAVAGCSKVEPPKTVEWYTAHPQERDARVALCKNDPGTFKNDPDCANAEAALISSWGKATLPPITFGPSASAASAAR